MTAPDPADPSNRPRGRPPARPTSDADHPLVHPPIRLHSTVVRYPVSPDRRTVFPPGLPDAERMTTWLSADDDAFVPLERAR